MSETNQNQLLRVLAGGERPKFGLYTADNKNCLSMNHLYTLLGCNWMFGDLFLKQRSFFRAYLVTILNALVWSNSAKCSKCFPPSIFIHTYYSGKWQSLAYQKLQVQYWSKNSESFECVLFNKYVVLKQNS